ncbi:MAG: hypothetical protein KGN02_01455 [bacterium]|nr:hypothetical protein [bacterium]
MSALPSAPDIIDSLDRDDVVQALREIDRKGVPLKRKSTKFCLEYKGRHYPPKLAISFASAFHYADDPDLHEGLDPNEFAGGSQSNKALSALGFLVVACKCGGLREMKDKPIRGKEAPRIARVVVNGRAAFDPERALRCLAGVARAIKRRGERFDIITTPGGFIAQRIEMETQLIGWEAPAAAFRAISVNAERSLQPFLESLREVALPADFLTLGVDVFLPGNPEDDANAQLVATVDLASAKIVGWTGKSYPTLAEEKELVHETNLQSHLQKIGRWRCLVLGCHDLNMFSPRSIATRDSKSSRGKRADALLKLAKAFDPQVVLQHPHNTDTPNIWMGGWAGVTRALNPKTYSSGIAYCWPRHGKNRRASLQETLERTKHGDVVDYIWSGVGKVSIA